MALPQFVVLKSTSNSKYLRYVEEDGKTHLQFCGEDVFGSDAKFEIQYEHYVPANKGSARHGPSRHDARLAHIRCCYNNRYLVKQTGDGNWIVAEAKVPEKDTSKSSCTLFQPIITTDANPQIFKFRHDQIQHFLSIDKDTDTLSADPNKPTVECVVIDLDLLLRLPKRVVFKDDRGHYLRSHQINNQPCMQFAEDVDKGDRTVMNEVFVTGDGYILIKSLGHGKFWRCDPRTNWIWADSDGDPREDALFWPVKIGDNATALRNKRNNSFCRRVTGDQDGKQDCLVVAGHGIIKEAHLVVEEPVTSRKIEQVKFRPEHARVKEAVMTLASKEITNKSPTESETEVLMLSYEKDESYTWSSSIQWKLGFKPIVVAGIPKLVNGKIEISRESSKSIEWGSTEKTSVGLQYEKVTIVKPRTTVKTSLFVTKASFDIPFSYIQCDILTSRDEVCNEMEDGVYSGVTCFNFKEESTEMPVYTILKD